jgi:acyl carrier protein phosphodiesterase
MNHLAHLFLAHDEPESVIGNLSGDFVKGPLGERFTAGIRAGIVMHRRIDTFTDSHPAVAATRQLLVPEFGHYGRIIADVFFDHFLATSFERYSRESLDEFLRRRFATLDRHREALPERLAQVYLHMRDGGWLQSYAEVAGIRQTLLHLSKRLSRQPHLELAARHLVDSRDALEARFQEFFPELVAYAHTL